MGDSKVIKNKSIYISKRTGFPVLFLKLQEISRNQYGINGRWNDNRATDVCNGGREESAAIGVLELLPLCNLNCDMCYVRMSREEMEEVGRLRTMEEWTKTAEDMMKAGTLFVLLTGGEPLLYHISASYTKTP